jgi:DNA-binding NtrC family response regulator
MKDTILISTHRLPVSGALRDAFRDKGYDVELVPSPDQMDVAGRPVLLILTGTRSPDEGADWARQALERMEILLFTALPGANGVVRGRELGALESFGPDPDPDEVVLLAHRAVERRRLQEVTGIEGRTEVMREVLERVVQIAPVESTVLITGESGTGKELVARGLHALSRRRNNAFLAVNVAALSDTLLESELFGHEKGAFTGAIDTRKGFFELAHRGTLFLDEIGEMPLSTQTKLLRVLEQREFLRVGGESPIKVDVRIITATNQELRQLVATGRFRRDLYYRLNILNIQLPPLRERREDIPVLVEHFVREVSRRLDRPFPGISGEAMEILVEHTWPGNVRELRNLVESMVVLNPRTEIGPDDIPPEIRSGGRALLPVAWSPRELQAGADDEDGRRDLRPELEFVFRTLVELRVDMDQLRHQFEAYREELEERLDESSAPSVILRSGEAALGRLRGDVGPGGRPFEVETGPGQGEFAGETLREAGREGGRGAERSPEADEEPEADGVVFRPGMTMEDLEREAIRTVLEETGGNRRKAAESLGIGERTLYRKLKKYGLDV